MANSLNSKYLICYTSLGLKIPSTYRMVDAIQKSTYKHFSDCLILIHHRTKGRTVHTFFLRMTILARLEHLGRWHGAGGFRRDDPRDKEARPDRCPSMRQNPKFPVWCMRPAREPRAVLAVGRVPWVIFVREIPQSHASTQRVDPERRQKKPSTELVLS